jgi:arylsulfatase A-like enzyme
VGIERLLERLAVAVAILWATALAAASAPTNVVLIMADDMGWGETSYNGHPVLRTPELDAMAANGLRFDRFYAGAPVCSPTRASVLTGRSNDRTGVKDHGYALRRQERTLARALREAGYATAHFGKWHLNGIRGAGVPVLPRDSHHPGVFGFDEWLAATNYFDLNPILGSPRGPREFEGDSSEVIVAEALGFLKRVGASEKAALVTIWFGSPHHPARALPADTKAFGALDRASQNHYGELVALDRAVGALRRGLRELGIAENTLVWFCSDNGGLKDVSPSTTGGLREFKGSLYEGGLRVPAIVEWPAVIKRARITRQPASTLDFFPTLADVAGLPNSAMLQPVDGTSLRRLFEAATEQRSRPLPFRFLGGGAWIDGRYKLVSALQTKGRFGGMELYDLEADPQETVNLAAALPDVMQQMQDAFAAWNESVEASIAGRDYPEGKVDPADRIEPRSWTRVPAYQPYLDAWLRRPEYRRVAESLRN